jgi:hypothetical protein
LPGALRRFLKLSLAEKALLARAWGLLGLVDLGLRLGSLAKLHAWLSRGLPPERALPNARQLAWDTWRLVDAASHHHVKKMSCLRRMLVLQRLLAEQGLRVDLTIGARKEQGELAAHAWIEVEGEAIGEARGAVDGFVTVLRLGRQA